MELTRRDFLRVGGSVFGGVAVLGLGLQVDRSTRLCPRELDRPGGYLSQNSSWLKRNSLLKNGFSESVKATTWLA
jgi:hypothetical protein